MYPEVTERAESWPDCPSCGNTDDGDPFKESVWNMRFGGWLVPAGRAYACNRCGHLILFDDHLHMFVYWPKGVHLSCLPALHA